MENINDLQSKPYATGVGEKILTNPSISNVELINTSLKRILGTNFGARYFNVIFGSSLSSLLFETAADAEFSADFTSKLVDEILRYEYRIDLSSSDIILEPDLANHIVILTINYRIKESLIRGTYKTGVQV